MADRQQRNIDWYVADETGNLTSGMAGAQLAVLMDIRRELQRLNNLVHCPNFMAMPAIMRDQIYWLKKLNARKRKRKARP